MNPANPVDQPMEEPVNNPEESNFGEILEQFELQQTAPVEPQPAEGGVLKGTVAAVNEDSIFVDLGGKSEGVLLKSAFTDGVPDIQVGDLIQVSVTGRNAEGTLELSPLKVERPKDWSELQAAFEEKRNIGGRVVEAVKGGLRVEVAGSRAFMPASRSGTRDAIELAKLVGQEIECRVINLDTVKEDVVVDRRVILEEEAAKAKEAAFQQLEEGSVVKGRVRSVTDFGAFLDLGGVDGLLHVTDMSWHRVGKPSDVVKIGDELEVKILKINRNSKKVSLGLKQLIPDPWAAAASQFKVGDRVAGKVARLTDFGAFIELAPGVDGLVHVSEMSWAKKVRKPADLLKVGDQVEVAILDFKPGDKKIQLSLKQTLGDPFMEAVKKYPVGAIVEAPVTSIQAFGAFVDLGDGVDGMIHIGDMVNEKRIDHPKDVVKVSEVVRAIVLEVDQDRRRIRLGLKQLQPTKTDDFIAEHNVGDTLTARVADVRSNLLKVEVADGVLGECRIAEEKKEAASAGAGRGSSSGGSVDVSALTAMLSAKWKEGKGGEPAAKTSNAIKVGQVRSFRITSLDPAAKKISLELVG
jgi:small subunit ribosomal protein S1